MSKQLKKDTLHNSCRRFVQSAASFFLNEYMKRATNNIAL